MEAENFDFEEAKEKRKVKMEGKFAKLKGNVVCSAIRKNITRCAKCSISFLGKDIYIYAVSKELFFFSFRFEEDTSFQSLFPGKSVLVE